MKNIDNVNTIISAKLNIEKNIVAAVNRVYWKEVKSHMTNLEDTTVMVKNLGSFTISKYLIRQKIFVIIGKIKSLKITKNFTEKRRLLILENYYGYLRKLLKQRNEVAKIYYERDIRIPKVDTKSIEEC